MEMILLDWTRMGKSYCLAGVVRRDGGCRVVRPLLARDRDEPLRTVGWSSYLLDGHARWEIFELIGPRETVAEPPHLEDLWVRTIRPQRQVAPPAWRREILSATTAGCGEAVFGTPLTMTRAAAYLQPGTGRRSLATIVVPS